MVMTGAILMRFVDPRALVVRRLLLYDRPCHRHGDAAANSPREDRGDHAFEPEAETGTRQSKGAETLREKARGVDPRRGPYLDNTDLAPALRALWASPR